MKHNLMMPIIFHMHTQVDGDQGQNACREVAAKRKNQEVKNRLLGSQKEANSIYWLKHQ